MPTEALPPPPGVVPVDISIRQMQSPTYQLSTGPRRNDTIAFKVFDKQVSGRQRQPYSLLRLATANSCLTRLSLTTSKQWASTRPSTL